MLGNRSYYLMDSRSRPRRRANQHSRYGGQARDSDARYLTAAVIPSSLAIPFA